MMQALEAKRAAGLDLVGVLVQPNHLYGRNLGDRACDPLYDALAAHGLALTVPEGRPRRPTMGAERFAGFTLRHPSSHPMGRADHVLWESNSPVPTLPFPTPSTSFWRPRRRADGAGRRSTPSCGAPRCAFTNRKKK